MTEFFADYGQMLPWLGVAVLTLIVESATADLVFGTDATIVKTGGSYDSVKVSYVRLVVADRIGMLAYIPKAFVEGVAACTRYRCCKAIYICLVTTFCKCF